MNNYAFKDTDLQEFKTKIESFYSYIYIFYRKKPLLQITVATV